MQITEHRSFEAPDDAWVVGDEPVKVIDWFGASDYAKQV